MFQSYHLNSIFWFEYFMLYIYEKKPKIVPIRRKIVKYVMWKCRYKLLLIQAYPQFQQNKKNYCFSNLSVVVGSSPQNVPHYMNIILILIFI